LPRFDVLRNVAIFTNPSLLPFNLSVKRWQQSGLVLSEEGGRSFCVIQKLRLWKTLCRLYFFRA